MRVRFPDSEIRGSEGARPYSRLIAACYVLHRLCAPRHPPDALALTLDRSAFVPCPEKRPGSRTIRRLSACAVPFLEWYLCDQIECLMDQPVVRPANPAFTCQRFRIRTDVRIQIVFLSKSKPRSNRIVGRLWPAARSCRAAKDGGADRDRTDDLKLAKLALSQLSYGPGVQNDHGFNWSGSPSRSSRQAARLRPLGFGVAAITRFAREGWWARDELNVRPHAYQACALTT